MGQVSIAVNIINATSPYIQHFKHNKCAKETYTGMVECLKAKMLKMTVKRFERPTRRPRFCFAISGSYTGTTTPQDARPEKSHIPAVFSPTTARHRVKLTIVCTKRRFMGSMSPNRVYIDLLTKLTPRPENASTILEKTYMKVENCSAFGAATSFFASLSVATDSFFFVVFPFDILIFELCNLTLLLCFNSF